MIYTIYEVPGVKIGCTNDLINRMRAQSFTEWIVLEEHTDGWLAGDRERELQKEHGYRVDKVHYMISLKNRPTWNDTDQAANGRLGKGIKKPGVAAWNRIHRLKLTQEQADEIRSKYIPRVYTQYMLAAEYNIAQSVISKILNNRAYKKD